MASPLDIRPCPTCEGNPRASLTCKSCHGSAVSASYGADTLLWNVPLDDFAFIFRRVRIQMNAFLHLALGLMVFGSFVGAVYGFISSHADPVDLLNLGMWVSGSWYMSLFWFGMFLLCFLIFRLSLYSDLVRSLPNWGKTKVTLEQDQVRRIKAPSVRDVSVYLHPAGWSLLEQAYTLAKNIGQAEVLPVHLFAAALTGPVGGIFLTRLGMNFDKVKDGLVAYMRTGQTGTPTLFSREAREILLRSYVDAYVAGRKTIGTIELFLQSFLADQKLQDLFDAAGYPARDVRRVAEWVRVQELLREQHDHFVKLAALKPKTAMNRSMTARATKLLDRYSEDLTIMARNGYIGPIVGREHEMNELLRAIESGRRSVVLVGEHGVGKQALVEALARRMVEEDVPVELFDRRLVSIHLPQLISAGDPSLAADRFLRVLHEVGMSGNIILVLHGIEALAGAGSTGAMDLAETLASELDKGYCIVIATTTPEAWKTYMERRSLGSKLVKIQVNPLESEEAIHVLMAKSGFIEYQNKVFFSYQALERAAELSARYLHDIALPESAIGIAQEAAVLAHRERGEHGFVLAEDVAKVIHEKTQVPVEAVTKDESQKLLDLEGHLHHRVIGQEDAVKAVSQAMRRARAEMREGKRPIANFLFLGPTGVGKTELSKALAAEYFGDEKAMIRLDMSEYQDRSAIARVIGEPGDERGGLLTEAVRQKPFSIVLLDELEKAHPDILTLFLQVMDDGRLTDGVGRTIDFTNVVLIATSNAGTGFIQEQVHAKTPLEQIKTALLERELKGTFRPEFLNRFDAVIVFKPLTLDEVTQIAWLLMGSITTRMQEKGMFFKAEDAAVEALAKAGFDPLFGARPLRRVIQDRVENGLADLLLRQQVHRRDTIVLSSDGTLRVESASV